MNIELPTSKVAEALVNKQTYNLKNTDKEFGTKITGQK
jgi:hypothetical protein